MKSFKDRLDGLAEQQRDLAKVIGDRVEERMVACVVEYHAPCEGTKRVVRTDTGEVVREEPMTDAEKQLNLFAAQAEFAQFLESQGLTGAAPADPQSEPNDEQGPGPDNSGLGGPEA